MTVDNGPQPRLYGIILAAGLSSRMEGRFKPLLDLGPGSMLALCARALREGGADSVLVVTGHRRDEVAEAARALRCEPVHNPDYAAGMFSSIRAGFRRVVELRRDAAGPAPAAVLLLPVDAPLVQAWSIHALADYWKKLAGLAPDKADQAVLIPSFAGKSGHPPLIGVNHVQKVLADQERIARNHGLRAYFSGLLQPDLRPDFEHGRVPAPSQARDSADAPSPVADGLPCPPVRAGADIAFIPMPDAGVAGDLDRPEDCDRAASFLVLTRYRSMPSPEEALEWLQGSLIGENKIRHSIWVAAGSFLLGEALREAGRKIDLPLIAAGGLLHDIVRKCSLKDKKCTAHARRGMDLLLARGWPECALVVGAHTVLPDSMLAALGLDMRDVPVLCRMRPKCPGGLRDEALSGQPPAAADPHAGASEPLLLACVAVYLADKFFFMDRHVSLDERFGIVIERFSGDEEAIRAISHRKQVALAVNAWFEKNTGLTAESILGHCKERMLSPASPPDRVSGPAGDCPQAGKENPGALWRAFLARLLGKIAP